MRVGVVHEWWAAEGGSERVVEAVCEALGSDEVFTLWADGRPSSDRVRVAESVLARSPIRGNKVAALALAPLLWRHTKFEEQVDCMVVSSHAFAHHARIRTSPGTPKLVYVHTPARYLWEPQLDPRGAGAAMRVVAPAFKAIDRRRAQEATAIAANSQFVRERIARCWGVDASVIYPPVDVSRIQSEQDWTRRLAVDALEILKQLPSEFILGASRFVSYKALDRVIDLGEAIGLPVVLAGSGPDEARLRARAESSTVPVYWVDRPETPLLYALYQRALLYVFPPVEDFGIMPVEAMAAGTPVVANATGGASETVKMGYSGATVSTWQPDELRQAAENALRIEKQTVAKYASQFSQERFQREFVAWVDSAFGGHS
ncbi:glycosyltransferase [Demequina maris]|uniref:glycosyltransferase n=1 Tax=Demequina maris TaxID=1638982 RepID=UPI0009E25A43|nr:glycosyltransferase [Demequina maris]